MKTLTECDWAYLAKIEGGENPTASSHILSRVRLEALHFIVTRPRNTIVITGLGRDTLMRREYRLGPPAQKKQYGIADPHS